MVLNDSEIHAEIKNGRIVIDPLDLGDVQPASVDVHLSDKILVFRNSRRPFIDIRQDVSDLTEMVGIREDAPFILHPGGICLGQHDRGHRPAG